MIRDGDDSPLAKPAVRPSVGEILDALSVEELRARIAMLRQEILRREAAITTKQASRQAADASFKT